MVEYYKILEPGEVPPPKTNPMRGHLATMGVGQTMAVPGSVKSAMYTAARALGIRVTARLVNGDVYLTRLPDDAK